MNLLSKKPKPAPAPLSVITDANLEAFLALPSTDPPGIGGEGFERYFGLCKSQAANIIAALAKLSARRLRDLDATYNINVPWLVETLLECGGLTIEQAGSLLGWFKEVSAEFHGEYFISRAVVHLASILNRISLASERFSKLKALVVRLKLFDGDWRWREAVLGLLKELLPEESFTRRVIAECIHTATKHNGSGVASAGDLFKLFDLLENSLRKYG